MCASGSSVVDGGVVLYTVLGGTIVCDTILETIDELLEHLCCIEVAIVKVNLVVSTVLGKDIG